MPWLNQLVTMRSQTFDPNRRSPSLEVIDREHVSPFLRARIRAQIIPIGVRDIVLPPIPTESPSRTNDVASSRDTTFSRRLRSRWPTSFRRSAYGRTTLTAALPWYR